MKNVFPANIEKFRITSGHLASDSTYGFNGFFLIPYSDEILKVMISDQMGWDHVSVSLQRRIPEWKEMHWIKRLFFDDEETVIQIHPPESLYVNRCEYCLHLWKNQFQEILLPPREMIG